jgi:membrane-associated protein
MHIKTSAFYLIFSFFLMSLIGCSKKHSLLGSYHNKKGYDITFNADSTVKVGYDATGKENFKFSTGTYSLNENAGSSTLILKNLKGEGITGNRYGLLKFVNGKTFSLQLDSAVAPTQFECEKKSSFVNTKLSLGSLLQPQFYIENGGLFMLIFIIFAETGLFAGFFFPGDSLLFVAGIYWEDISHSFLNLPFGIIMLLVALAAIIGNIVGYWIGKKIGPAMYKWKDKWYFRQKHLVSAKEFYDEKGASAIIIARFIPIVRTFAPIIAGIVQMDYKKYLVNSVIGAIAWVGSMMMLGRYLQAFLMKKYCYDLTHHIEYIVLGIVFVTTFPVFWKLVFGKKKATKNEPTQ